MDIFFNAGISCQSWLHTCTIPTWSYNPAPDLYRHSMRTNPHQLWVPSKTRRRDPFRPVQRPSARQTLAMCTSPNNSLASPVPVELACPDLHNWKTWSSPPGIPTPERSHFGAWPTEPIGYRRGLNFSSRGSRKCERMTLTWDLGHSLVVLVRPRPLSHEKHVFLKSSIMLCGFNRRFPPWLRSVHASDWTLCNASIYRFCSWKARLRGLTEVRKILSPLDSSRLLDHTVLVWCRSWQLELHRHHPGARICRLGDNGCAHRHGVDLGCWYGKSTRWTFCILRWTDIWYGWLRVRSNSRSSLKVSSAEVVDRCELWNHTCFLIPIYVKIIQI